MPGEQNINVQKVEVQPGSQLKIELLKHGFASDDASAGNRADTLVYKHGYYVAPKCVGAGCPSNCTDCSYNMSHSGVYWSNEGVDEDDAVHVKVHDDRGTDWKVCMNMSPCSVPACRVCPAPARYEFGYHGIDRQILSNGGMTVDASDFAQQGQMWMQRRCQMR